MLSYPPLPTINTFMLASSCLYITVLRSNMTTSPVLSSRRSFLRCLDIVSKFCDYRMCRFPHGLFRSAIRRMACGRIFHSACSMTRRCSISGVSSCCNFHCLLQDDRPGIGSFVHKMHGRAGSLLHRACKRCLRALSAHNIRFPQNAGISDGWMLMIRFRISIRDDLRRDHDQTSGQNDEIRLALVDWILSRSA